MNENRQPEASLIPMGRLHALALSLFGPPDTQSHPFTGTKYDPRLKQHQDAARRAARNERRHPVVEPIAS